MLCTLEPDTDEAALDNIPEDATEYEEYLEYLRSIRGEPVEAEPAPADVDVGEPLPF